MVFTVHTSTGAEDAEAASPQVFFAHLNSAQTFCQRWSCLFPGTTYKYLCVQTRGWWTSRMVLLTGCSKSSGSQRAGCRCHTRSEDPHCCRLEIKEKKNMSVKDSTLARPVLENKGCFHRWVCCLNKWIGELSRHWSPQEPKRGIPRERANGARLPQVDDAPHVCAEPHGRAGVGLVLPDEDWVRDGQQADQSAVLEELKNFWLVRQTPGKRQAHWTFLLKDKVHPEWRCTNIDTSIGYWCRCHGWTLWH